MPCWKICSIIKDNLGRETKRTSTKESAAVEEQEGSEWIARMK